MARACGVSLKKRRDIAMTDAAVRKSGLTPEQRALLAAACDLYDILIASPTGWQALADLGLEPLFQNGKGE